MQFFLRHLFPGMWLAWAIYWLVSASDIKPPVRRESRLSRWGHFLPLILTGWLLHNGNHYWPPLDEPFMPRTVVTYWLAAALTALGLLYAVWARRELGRNWSGSVTVKEGHELITSGPYRYTRHPIYSGILLALAGTSLIIAEWRAPLGFLIAFLSLWRKLKLEERWMREQFGSAYEEYARRVAALVPHVL